MSTSLYFQGNSTSYISFYYDPYMQFGTGDYTIQWFQYLTSNNTNQRIFQHGNYNDSTVTIGTSFEGDNTSLRTLFYWEPTAINIWSLNPIDFLNTWVHIAISRTSGTARFFVNGNLVKKIEGDNTNFNYGGAYMDFVIGNESFRTDAAAYGGYLYGFCWTKGKSLYTTDATFAIPSSLPEADSNTILILTGDGFSGSLTNRIQITNNNVILGQTNIPPSIHPTPPTPPTPPPAYDYKIKLEESLDRKKYPLTNTSQSGRIAALKNATINTVRNTYGGGTGVYTKNETEKNSVNDAIRRVRAGGYIVPPKITDKYTN